MKYIQYVELMCSCCKKRPVVVKGLCKTCYARMKYRKENGIPLDSPKYSSSYGKTYKKVLELYKSDSISQSEIARVCGVSRQRVHTIIKKYKKESESA